MKKKLPPLDSLRFFEAVGRLLSIRQAAEELCVTPGAVSQQIRKLEDFLECGLFTRESRGLLLTPAGDGYLDACREALQLIERATARVHAQRRVIVVSCTPGFGTQWLIPRLQEFMTRQPNIDVHISTTNRVVDLAREEVDLVIRHGLGNYPGLLAERLVDDGLVAVCSPTLPARIESIEGAQLLHDEQRGDWKLWADANGIALDSNQGVLCVDSNAVIEAALAGRGYALVRQSLIERELAAGRLHRVPASVMNSPLAYYLVYRPDALRDPELQLFRAWLLACAGKA